MIIGIDIDDTLTDIRDEIKKIAEEYIKELGKEIPENNLYIENKNNGNVYKEKYNFTDEELKIFLKRVEKIQIIVKPRDNAKQIINKLKEEGNKIYIVTARDSEFHDDPYLLSKEWLEKNEIQYDKIIANARDKAKICEDEKIDLFIDDQLGNCMKIAKTKTKVIRITNYTDIHDENIVNISNWKDIYKFINNM